MNKIFFRSLVLLAIGLLIMPLLAYAQIFDEFESDNAPIFVTPSRMASSYADSPNSVTRLETKDLYYLGITTVTDALRLVPGMFVSDVQSNDPAIGYHGSNVNVPRRMEVLFNSNSIYRPGYANLQWQRLPVDINDLTAIEVVRGSNVVDFGSNAFSGTINLIPAQPVLEPTFSTNAILGSGSHKELWLRHHFSTESGEYILRYFHKESTGFDELLGGVKIDDYLSGDNLLFMGEIEINNGSILDFTLAVNEYSFTPTRLETLFEDDIDLEFAIGDTSEADEHSASIVTKYSGADKIFGDNLSWYFTGNYVRYKRKQSINLCIRSFFFDPLLEQLDNSPNVHLVREDIPLVLISSLNTGIAQLDQSIISPLSDSDNELLEQIGQRTLDIGPIELLKKRCGKSDISVNEDRYKMEMSAMLRRKNSYTVSSVLNVSNSKATSKHYLNGTVNRTTYTSANNFRYYLNDDVVFNFGFHFEANNRIDDTYLSNRSSLNWKVNKHSILRATVSHSERSPDIYELDRFWNYYVVFDEGVTDHLGNTQASLPRNATSPEFLDSEKIDTSELGYIYTSNTHKLDIKWFKEELYDLISEPFIYIDFNLTNNGEANLTGTELAYSYDSMKYFGLKFGLNYLYLKNKSNNDFEKTIYSKNSGSLFLILPVTNDYTFGSTVYYLDEFAGHDYKRFDFNLAYVKNYQDIELKLSVNYRFYPDVIYSFTEVSADNPIASQYDNNQRVFINLSIEY